MDSSAPTPGLPVESPPNAPPELDLPDAPQAAGPDPQTVVEDLGAGKAKPESVSEAEEALRWLLEDPPEEDDLDVKAVRLNIGKHDEPRWIELQIRAVAEPDIRRIRQGAQKRAAKLRGAAAAAALDETDINCRVIAKAIVVPDLTVVQRERGVQPHDWVRLKFAAKPGHITQLVGEVYELSGYDDADLTDVGGS